MVGVSTASWILGVGFRCPLFSAAQYCGTRMTPCESWPRRFARTSSIAIQSASARGTWRAAKISAVSRSSSAAGTIGIGRYTTRRDAGRKGPGVETLGPRVEWVPVCPEVELGLGVPRPPIRLEGDARAPRLVVAATGEDLTARMRRFAEARLEALARLDLDGYVLKRASPSCGP